MRRYHAGQRAVLFALGAYKVLLSPLFRGSCRFIPSCADYTAEAVARHGVARGISLGLQRLARCRPFATFGFDPVPPASHCGHDQPFGR